MNDLTLELPAHVRLQAASFVLTHATEPLSVEINRRATGSGWLVWSGPAIPTGDPFNQGWFATPAETLTDAIKLGVARLETLTGGRAA